MQGPNRTPSRLVATALAIIPQLTALSVEAKEVQKITHDLIALCAGSSGGGKLSQQKIGAVNTLDEQGNIVTHKTTRQEIYSQKFEKGEESEQVERYRDWVIHYFEGDAKLKAGWYFYNYKTFKLDFVVSSGTFPEVFVEGGNGMHITQGATLGDDRLIILAYPAGVGSKATVDFYVHESPVTVNGTLTKPKFLGKSSFDKTTLDIDSTTKSIGNAMYMLKGKKEGYMLTKCIIDGSTVKVADKVLVGTNYVQDWVDKEQVFVHYFDGKGQKKTYIAVSDYIEEKDIHVVRLINKDDFKDIKEIGADSVISSNDGRYYFAIGNETDSEVTLHVTDNFSGLTWKLPKTPVLSTSLNAELPGLPHRAFAFLIGGGKGVYVLEQTNEQKNEWKLKQDPFPDLENLYYYNSSGTMGGFACVPVLDGKVTKEAIGGQAEVVEGVEAVEKVEVTEDVEQDTDAGTSDANEGSPEIITDDTKDTQNPPDALDSSVDGQNDAPDTLEVEPDTISQPETDTAIALDANSDGTPDQSTPPDEITRVDIGKDIPVETGGADTTATTETSRNKPDASVSADTANKSDTAPTTKPKPPVNDGCTATGQPSEDGLLATGILIAGVAYAVRRRRREISMIER